MAASAGSCYRGARRPVKIAHSKYEPRGTSHSTESDLQSYQRSHRYFGGSAISAVRRTDARSRIWSASCRWSESVTSVSNFPGSPRHPCQIIVTTVMGHPDSVAQRYQGKAAACCRRSLEPQHGADPWVCQELGTHLRHQAATASGGLVANSSWGTLAWALTLGMIGTQLLGAWALAGLIIAPPVLQRMARRESGSRVAEWRERALQTFS